MNTIVDTIELGRRIRALRLDRRMTLKQVEVIASLSATHLSEIERGRTSPTIGALVRIARALGRDASYFIEQEERPEVARQSAETAPTQTVARGVTVSSLTKGIPGSRIFAYRVELDGGSLNVPVQEVPGDAIYMVRSGGVVGTFGDAEIRLDEGDAVQTTFHLPHRLSPAGNGRAEITALLTNALPEAVLAGSPS